MTEKTKRPGRASGHAGRPRLVNAPVASMDVDHKCSPVAKGRKPSLSERGRLAISYAEDYGWHVFPIKANTKDKPLVKWGNEATNHCDQIRKWWQEWPRANIGIATGPSRLCVVDLDNKNGKSGEFEFDLAYSGNLSYLSNVSVFTPSGGRHIFFIGSTQSKVDLLPGVDIRSRGGYVVAPGSEVGGKAYEWFPDGPPSPDHWHNQLEVYRLPASVKELFRVSSSLEAKHPNDVFFFTDHEADIQWARNYLKQTVAKTEGDASDNQTFIIACEFRNRGLSLELVSELMAYEWEHSHDTDWVIQKVQNAYEYATGLPGSNSILNDFSEDPPSLIEAQKLISKRGICRLGLKALSELPPPLWQVEDMIPQGGLIVVYGQPKVGKTFFAIALSLSIASGSDLFGRATKKGKVTYIAAEGGPARLRDRARAFLTSIGVATPPEDMWGLISQRIDVADDNQVTELLEELGGSHDLVVIDTLARCMSGDENSQKDMNEFVAGCDRIREATGATVVVVHHEGKDRSKGARGSTVLRGALDTSIRLRQNANGIIASVEDQRDGTPGNPITLELATIPLGDVEEHSTALRLTEEGPRTKIQEVRDVASEMDGANQSELASVLIDHGFTNSSSSANRLIKEAIPKGLDDAVIHGEGRLWIEPIMPGHPRKGLKVRYEK